MDAQTVEAIAAIRTDIRREGLVLRAEMRAAIGSLLSELRAELTESRRQSTALYERLHHELRLIAEGVASLSAEFDPLQPPR
jgi:hypothetical protein